MPIRRFDQIRFRVFDEPAGAMQLGIFSAFMLEMERSRRSINIFHRGNKLSAMKQRLGITLPGNKELGERLFLIGDKAKNFLKQDEIKNSGNGFKMEEVDERVFEYVFRKMKEMKKNGRKYFIHFFENNPGIDDFFVQKNKQLFLDNVASLTYPEKLAVRNYYLILLHQLAEGGYTYRSHFVSASSSETVASGFAGREDDSILIYAWQPYSKHIIEQLLKRVHLPKYRKPFPSQKEFSFAAGILPHYMIGFMLKSTNEFHINPALFVTKQLDAFVFKNGFEVDQRLFPQVMQETGYHSYFIYHEGLYQEINTV